ncbi:hypothetical protein LB505_001605 [Fusarium chuoi]|nr:hypothetical protein LB505_001605 [Fusarium chuoi]
MSAPSTFGELGLSIIGIGAEYPPYSLDYTCLNTLSDKFYPDTPSSSESTDIPELTHGRLLEHPTTQLLTRKMRPQ